MLPRTEPIKVGIAEDHPLLRRGLVNLLASTDDIEVVAEVADGESAIELLGSEREPEVIVVDLRMPGIDGLETTRRLRAERSDLRVVILSASEDPRAASAAARAGASAFVGKSADGEEFLETVRMVARGHLVFGRDTWEAMGRASTGERATTLSGRERDVLRLLSRGRSNRQMAAELGVSLETVKTHLERLYRRLGVSDRTGAVAAGLRAGLID